MDSSPAERAAQLRTFHHSRYAPQQLAAARAQRALRVSVCLPARECAATVAEIVATLDALRAQGVLDEIVVVDAASSDGTARVARGAGAVVLQESELMASQGPVLGKGDAMWRALPALSGDIVCFLDADTEAFPSHFVTGLLGPLLCEPDVSFCKAFYRRPLQQGDKLLPDGGGRVNQLTARPALALFYPQLAAVSQPLAGEVAARRELLWRLPFTTGYGVEIGMLIDAWRALGVEGMAQVDLEEHRNRHQPLSALEPMACAVLATVTARLREEGRLTGPEPASALEQALVERPAHASLADDREAAPATALDRETA